MQRSCSLDSASAHWAKPGVIFLPQNKLGACSVLQSAVKQYTLAQIDKLICWSFECGALHQSQLWKCQHFSLILTQTIIPSGKQKQTKKTLYCLFWRPDDNNLSFEGQGVNLDAMRGDPNS